MKATRNQASAFALAAAGALLALGATLPLHAHGTEARRVELLSWTRDRIVRVIGANRSELGLNGSKVPTEIKTIGGRSCLFGDLFAFDVEDSYAFDIDEAVDVTHHLCARAHPAVHRRLGSERRRRIRPLERDQARARRRSCARRRFGSSGRGWPASASCRPILPSPRAAASRSVTSRSRAAATTKAACRRRHHPHRGQGRRNRPCRAGARRESTMPPAERRCRPSESILVHRYADETRLFWVAPQIVWPSTNRQAFYTSGTYEARVPAGPVSARRDQGARVPRALGHDYRQGGTDDHGDRVAAALYRSTDARLVFGRYPPPPDARQDRGSRRVGRRSPPRMSRRQPARDGQHRHDPFPPAGVGARRAASCATATDRLGAGRSAERPSAATPSITTCRRRFTCAKDQFFSYHKVFEASHAQGGVSGYAHHGQLFNGRRGLALDVPFGLVDFIEVLQGGRLDAAAWYPFLNLGFKVSPAAGSDYPYFGPSLPGAERYYVKLDRPFDARRVVRLVQSGPRLRHQRAVARFHDQRRTDGRRAPRGEGRASRSSPPRPSSIPTSTRWVASKSSSTATSWRREQGNGQDRIAAPQRADRRSQHVDRGPRLRRARGCPRRHRGRYGRTPPWRTARRSTSSSTASRSGIRAPCRSG